MLKIKKQYDAPVFSVRNLYLTEVLGQSAELEYDPNSGLFDNDGKDTL